MAPIRGRRKQLTCFYCNTRSGIKYDGIRQWECTYCDAQNYLDENGDITDPPVATELAAPANLQYSTRPVSPEIWEHDIFCATCLKNQHIVAAAIAEYPFDTDTRRPGYLRDEREYNKYKLGLENRFPQVCGDCEPKVLSQMRQAGKTAKTDHLRRMMEKSREAKSAPSKGVSFFGIVLSFTRLLWYMSIIGQFLWDIAPILDMVRTEIVSNAQLSSSLAPVLNSVTTVIAVCKTTTWARYSLICGFASIWWNPEFDPVTKAFKKRLKGFDVWYTHQLMMIVLRTVFYYAIRKNAPVDPIAHTTLAAHSAALVVFSYLINSATSAIKVDKAPLWANTPEKLANIGPSPSSSSPNGSRGMETLGDLLDEISRDIRPSDSQPLHSYPSPGSSPSSSPPATSQTRTPAHSRTYNSQIHSPQVRIPYAADEMEWLPTVSQTSSFRVFTPPSRPQTAQKFGESPVGDQPSPFWYKVPPAPIAPAHRVRNPPNKPTFVSQQVKENFFTKPSTNFSVDPGRNGMEMKQQSLFIPENPNPEGDLLSGMMGSISISEGDAPRHKDVSSRIGVAMIGVVAVGLASWCIYQF
ncbi:Ima1 N-terminal domain-containing protein [Rhexocercosporidium sp. MPI-PUGE-AT-0058]|nr:Ima1 N-terminal domain-containing protein [Rhexocercosporidium sp. MPI-PUGE-AT-0058]